MIHRIVTLVDDGENLVTGEGIYDRNGSLEWVQIGDVKHRPTRVRDALRTFGFTVLRFDQPLDAVTLAEELGDLRATYSEDRAEMWR